MHAEKPGDLIGKQDLICVPFGGGLSELPFFNARQILINDKHEQLYNLYHVLQNHSNALQDLLSPQLYHPKTLSEAKVWLETGMPTDKAFAFFLINWLTRCAGGTEKEANGALAMRWTASGGSSIARWRSAVECLPKWAELLRTKCECTCLDWREIADNWKDRKGHALYLDPPWIGAGDDYLHKFSVLDHGSLFGWVKGLSHTTVVIRHSDDPLYREMYKESDGWEWFPVDAKNQAGNSTGEVLIRNVGN